MALDAATTCSRMLSGGPGNSSKLLWNSKNVWPYGRATWIRTNHCSKLTLPLPPCMIHTEITFHLYGTWSRFIPDHIIWCLLYDDLLWPCIHIYVCLFVTARGGGMVQWWEHSPPPMWSRFDLQIQRQMWVELVGSLLCTERFSPGTPVSPLLKNQNLTWLC